MSFFYPLNITTSLAATFLRGGAGVSAHPASHQPAQLLKLYEFEGCPHCRLVREVLTELDIDALILPCPKGGHRYRDEVIEQGGKAQFPYLIDPNTDVRMYESSDIIDYLFATYAGRAKPWHWRAIELQRFSSVLASLPRMGQGIRVKASRAPQQPLELYSFESSPFARPVRDLLCEMELPYILHSVGRTKMSDWVPPALRQSQLAQHEPDTRNRRALQTRVGVISIPYLVDPNTGIELAESADILEYLQKTYAL
ncbi:MAG: glutathione S-transferase N-terminal domain-containing protein [bacterium]